MKGKMMYEKPSQRKNTLWAVLMTMVAFMTTACSNEDNAVTTGVIIPYTVTVGDDGGAATTRATVDDDFKTLFFAEGDKLYISGTDIKGELDIQKGVGTTGATFSGNLIYTGEGTPANNLKLTATLVSAQQKVGKQVSVDSKGAVTVNYPTEAYCTSVNDAVQQYSRLTGTSTFGAKSFKLTQQTAFLNFIITFKDGTTSGDQIYPEVSINGSTSIAKVTTTKEDYNVVAKFVRPVASGTRLWNNWVVVSLSPYLFAFNLSNGVTLEGKVYNVKKTQDPPSPLNISNPKLGQVIGIDGTNYNYNKLPSGMPPVAKICYVNGSHGLALAMTDEEGWSTWYTAKPTAAAHTPAFSSGGTWKLASKSEWDLMVNAAKGFTNLCKGFESVGGTNMEDNLFYWSSTQINGTIANSIASWGWTNQSKDGGALVRACLDF